MQIHEIKRAHPNKAGKTVGRGGKRGKTSGKGTKGQNARAGRKFRPALRDAIKKLPKLRGRGSNMNKAFRAKPSVVNLRDLNLVASSGAIINPVTLLEMGLVQLISGRMPKVKILGLGTLDKKLSISGCQYSEAVRTKVEAAGGTITE